MSGVDVLTRGEVLESALQAREYLVTCGVPAALAAKDPRLWGRKGADHSKLSWLDLPDASRKLLPRLDDLVEEARDAGLDHIALVSVGAESLAAQALAEGGPGTLTVLDGSDSAGLQTVLDRLDRTLVVIASKRGVSLEGDAYRRIFERAFRDRGLTELEITGRFLVITDHGSPLDSFARECGYRIGLTDPFLPGHFGALSAYGVVPALLAGADVGTLLDEAAAVLPALSVSEDNPGLLLGAVLGGCAGHLRGGVARDKVVLSDLDVLQTSGFASGPGVLAGRGGLEQRGGSEARRGAEHDSPLAAWVAQLVATATGRDGRGVLLLDPAGRPGGTTCPDVHAVALNPATVGDADTSLWAPTGAQVVIWEYATAVAGWLLGVNPFDPAGQVAWEGEDEAAAILRSVGERPLPTGLPVLADHDLEVYADTAARDLDGLLDSLAFKVPPTGYLSVVNYLPGGFPGRELAGALARRSRRPVSYGTGPGHLQGTGGYHKQGPGGGSFLVVSGDPAADQPIPGRLYTLGTLCKARALADVRALRRRGLTVVWVHLRNRDTGGARLLAAAT